MKVLGGGRFPKANSLKSVDGASIFIVFLAFALGAFVRFTPVLSADFPLNDGGLVYVLTENLRQNHYVLPAQTTYNTANIPFAYPPLAFYLLASISDILGTPLIDILRVLPALVSSLCILAFYAVARVILQSKSKAAIAVLAFAFVPRSFEWMIMGGGITRSLGLLFSLLAVAFVYRLYTRGGIKIIVATILAASLTVLSHPESSWFVIYTAALMFLFFGRNRLGVLRSLAVAGGVLAVTAVWWVSLILTHGLRPLVSASGSHFGSSWIGLLSFYITDESLLPLVGVLGLLGLCWCITSKKYFLPLWLVAILLLESRSANTMAMIPLSLMAAIGMEEFILRAFVRKLSQSKETPETGNSWAEDLLQTRAAKVVLAFFLLYILGAAFIFLIVSPLYKVLPLEERMAMKWAKANTPADSLFLVFSGTPWWQDASSEWFPVLAERTSLLTVQGAEWLPVNEFRLRWERYKSLQSCANEDVFCLQEWLDKNPVSFQFIYLSNRYLSSIVNLAPADDFRDLNHFPKLYYSLKGSPGYTLVFEQSGVAIFQKSKQP